jgi:hypothetical protein
MKRTLFRVLLAILVLALVLGIAGFVILDRDAWMSSRRLVHALQGARSVVLVEFTGDVVLAQASVTSEEMARLRNATSVWFWPFLPKAYLCYEPHHRIQVVRADGSTLNFDVCFLCDKFAVSDDKHLFALPPSLRKSLDSFFTSVGMAPKTHEEYTDMEVAGRRSQTEGTKKQLE